LARDEARTAIRRRQHLTLIKGEASDRAADDPEALLEQRERMAGVERALAQLAERDREVLLLWDAGLSYDEIAAETGLKLGAIGTTLARARRRLVEAHEKLEDRDVARG
jgi:RNA polymerase sigma-70 factor (ECF subfamily)